MSAKQEGIKACLAKALDRMLYETTRMFAIEGARRVTVTVRETFHENQILAIL